ncbi:MAG TPA: sigma-70 family RNA polymerase sigma factor [Mycobacteriales bacterium]|nr:sigma-70 family RNA polymerase sigma factor [Mycobacteriales bacterium]
MDETLGADAGPDAAAWLSLAARRDRLLRIAYRLAGSPEEAEDAVQEALTRAAQNWHRIDLAQLDAWLVAVTRRICMDFFRRQDVERRHLARLLPQSPVDPQELVSDRAEDQWLSQQIQALPAQQQRALRKLAEDRSIPAVANALGLSRQATESLVKRARAALRSRLAATLTVLWGPFSRRHPQVPTLILIGNAVVTATVLGMAVESQNQDGSALASDGSHAIAVVRHQPSLPKFPQHRSVLLATASAQSRRPPSARRDIDAVVRPGHILSAGPVAVHDHGTDVQRPQESLFATAEKCLDGGLKVTPGYVGCT